MQTSRLGVVHGSPRRVLAAADLGGTASSGTVGRMWLPSTVPHPSPSQRRRHGGPRETRQPLHLHGVAESGTRSGVCAYLLWVPHPTSAERDTTHGMVRGPTITTQHHQTQRLGTTQSSRHPPRRRTMPRLRWTRSRPSRPRRTRIPRRNTRPNKSTCDSRFTMRSEEER
jgi:hypothetical protein